MQQSRVAKERRESNSYRRQLLGVGIHSSLLLTSLSFSQGVLFLPGPAISVSESVSVSARVALFKSLKPSDETGSLIFFIFRSSRIDPGPALIERSECTCFGVVVRRSFPIIFNIIDYTIPHSIIKSGIHF